MAEVAANPVGTGPPLEGPPVDGPPVGAVVITGAVVIGDLVGALGVDAEVVVLAGATSVVVGEDGGPPDPQPVSDSAVSNAAVTITTPDACRKSTVLIAPSELGT